MQWTPQEIRRRRLARGLEQTELAELLAAALGEDKPVSRRAITNWEQGHSIPRDKYLGALDQVLGDTDDVADDVTLRAATNMQLLAELARRIGELEAALETDRPNTPDPMLGNWRWPKDGAPSARRLRDTTEPPEVDPSEQEM